MDPMLFQRSRAYVLAHCTPAGGLARAAGVSPASLARLGDLGLLPQPTYRVSPRGIASAIGAIGDLGPGEGDGYYGAAVIPWLRRADAEAARDPAAAADAMRAWLAEGLRSAAQALPQAAAFGWAAVVGEDGLAATRDEVARCWPGWIAGGWAVCLRRFDGRHLAVKEHARRRIASLTDSWRAERLSTEVRLALVDAMRELDDVLLPFAPFERPGGTPGLFLDRTAARYGLPWSGPVWAEAQAA